MDATYANLAALRLRNSVAIGGSTAGDKRYVQKLRAATTAIRRYCFRDFLPTITTRHFDYESETRLNFHYQDLLELTTLHDAQQSLNLTDLSLLSVEEFVNGPYYGVELLPTTQYFIWYLTKVQAIAVTGTWGWHDDYAHAWVDTGLTATVADTLGPTTWTWSADPDVNEDTDGTTPALSVGDLIKVESEYGVVKSVTTTTGKVSRGMRGTTAAPHATKAVYRWVPPLDVIEACTMWASYLLLRDDADENGITLMANGDRKIPSGFPSRIFDLLDPLQNVRVS